MESEIRVLILNESLFHFLLMFLGKLKTHVPPLGIDKKKGRTEFFSLI